MQLSIEAVQESIEQEQDRLKTLFEQNRAEGIGVTQQGELNRQIEESKNLLTDYNKELRQFNANNKNSPTTSGTPFDNKYDTAPAIEAAIDAEIAADELDERERLRQLARDKSVLESAERARQAYALSVSRGIISGFQSGGVRGALESFARSLQEELLNGAAKGLAQALLGAGSGGSGDFLSSIFTGLFGGGGSSGGGAGAIPSIAGPIQGILRMNKGGIVPGIGNTDSVLAALTPGERVIPKGESAGSTYNITIAATDYQSFENMLARDPKMIAQIAEVGREATTGLGR